MTERGTFKVLSEADGFSRYPVRPKDFVFLVKEEGHWLESTFGKMEVEQRAEKLVQFFIERGAWVSFTLAELNRFYEFKGWDTRSPFFGLCGVWFDDGALGNWREPLGVFIVCDAVGNFYVTDHFVEHCANAVRLEKIVLAMTT